jgi:hypothetical protein
LRFHGVLTLKEKALIFCSGRPVLLRAPGRGAGHPPPPWSAGIGCRATSVCHCSVRRCVGGSPCVLRRVSRTESKALKDIPYPVTPIFYYEPTKNRGKISLCWRSICVGAESLLPVSVRHTAGVSPRAVRRDLKRSTRIGIRRRRRNFRCAAEEQTHLTSTEQREKKNKRCYPDVQLRVA